MQNPLAPPPTMHQPLTFYNPPGSVNQIGISKILGLLKTFGLLNMTHIQEMLKASQYDLKNYYKVSIHGFLTQTQKLNIAWTSETTTDHFPIIAFLFIHPNYINIWNYTVCVASSDHLVCFKLILFLMYNFIHFHCCIIFQYVNVS